MMVGYARVSTGEQNPNMQIDALKAAGCEEIFIDELGGAKTERPGVSKGFVFVRQNDTLMAGLHAARARGRLGGRHSLTDDQINMPYG
jgi:DNA invertase Pin-like site-specific DNA recombinase